MTSLQHYAVARLRDQMRERNIEAYVCTSDATLRYLLDYKVSDALPDAKITGLLVAVLPADDAHEMTVVTNDFRAARIKAHTGLADVRAYRSWVEIRSLAELRQPRTESTSRPVQWSPDERDALVGQALDDAGVTGGSIAIDVRINPEDLNKRLRSLRPKASFVDSYEMVYAARSVKCQEEVSRIRTSVQLTEAGMRRVLANYTSTATVDDVERQFKAGAHEEAATVGATIDGAWILSDRFQSPAEGWATLKLDAGLVANGYNCDGGRSFALGGTSPQFTQVYRLLQEAHARAIAAVRPGVAMSQVFLETERFIQDNGLPGFSRGHFGHSVGLDPFPEEPPFISPSEAAVFEQGMVLAVEVPFYGADIGSIQIEDTVLVTAGGCEPMHSFSYDLLDLKDRSGWL